MVSRKLKLCFTIKRCPNLTYASRFMAVLLPIIYTCVYYIIYISVQFNSVNQSCPTLWPHGLQQARPPWPSPTPKACSNSCPSSWWCHPTISSSVIPFSCLQSFPASGSSPVSQFFVSGGQSIGASASASVSPMNIQVWLPLWLYIYSFFSEYSTTTYILIYTHLSLTIKTQ